MVNTKQQRNQQIKELERELSDISQSISELETQLHKKNEKLMSLLRVVDMYEQQ